MRFPKLNIRPQSREFIQEFGGLDRRVRISENCFAEMQNMTGDFYPALAPRRRRGVVGQIAQCNAMTEAAGRLAYVDGNTLYWGIGADAVTMELKPWKDTPRQLVMMGAYLVVFPDNMYLNTANTDDRGAFHMQMGSDTEEFTFSLYYRADTEHLPQAEEFRLSVDGSTEYRLEGTSFKKLGDYKDVCVYHSPKTFDLEPDKYSAVLEGVPHFSAYEVEWIPNLEGNDDFALNKTAGEKYIEAGWNSNALWGKIKVTDIQTGETVEHTTTAKGNGENAGCVVNTSAGYWVHCDAAAESAVLHFNGSKVASVLRVDSPWFSNVRFPNGFKTEVEISVTRGEERLIPYLSGVPTGKVEACFQDGSMWIEGCICGAPRVTTFSRDAVPAKNYTVALDVVCFAPRMDHVIEAQNRLWGCRYGKDANGGFVNEIYACALGDFRQWYTFSGVSTDSYTASVGMSGAFTGAVNFRGFPLFFKENVMYKVYGDYPENYQIIADTGVGVQAGCSKSLFVLANTLYYKSPDGVCAYNGSDGGRIDTVLGSEQYEGVVCAGAGDKLWLAMESEHKEHAGLYVYDTGKGLWHREDGVIAKAMARVGSDVYIVDTGGHLLTVNGSVGEPETEPIRFFAQTGVIGYSTPESKYVSRFALRVSVPPDGVLRIFIEYDSANVWEFKGCIEGNGMRTFPIPVVPRLCDHFRIRLEGEGDCRIFGFSKVLEEGGSVS